MNNKHIKASCTSDIGGRERWSTAKWENANEDSREMIGWVGQGIAGQAGDEMMPKKKQQERTFVW
jgi:hypothetical protein